MLADQRFPNRPISRYEVMPATRMHNKYDPDELGLPSVARRYVVSDMQQIRKTHGFEILV